MPKKQLPLEKVGKFVTKGLVTGANVQSSVFRRGLMEFERREYDDYRDSSAARANFDARTELEGDREAARQILRNADLPTDVDEVRLADGQVLIFSDNEPNAKWFYSVEDRAEPLSPEGVAMRFIQRVNHILTGNYDANQIREIYRLMRATRDFVVCATELNQAAVDHRAATKNLGHGRNNSHRQAQMRAQIVLEKATVHWRTWPRDKTNRSATAAAILRQVRESCLDAKLKPVGDRGIQQILKRSGH